MNYTIESIVDFCKGEPRIIYPGSKVGRINIDHRITQRRNALFAALKGSRFDGHDFIPELLDFGVHHFLVTDAEVAERYADQANFIIVKDVVKALQMIAAEHRDNFNTEIIAITGSNGKTIIKEWLNMLLEHDFRVCRSPKSYNSQIGVPLSVFELSSNDTLGIFEAGISQPDEMQRLYTILQPNFGIFTNLGDAHAVHFASDEQKLKEKWILFESAYRVVACKDQSWVKWLSEEQREKCFFWSTEDPTAKVFVASLVKGKSKTECTVRFREQEYRFKIPFTDRMSIENAMHCFATLCMLDNLTDEALERFEHLAPVSMRMEVKQGVEDSLLIDDTYNADLESLRGAIDLLVSHADRDKWAILTDFSENLDHEKTYREVAQMLKQSDVTQLIALGPSLSKYRDVFAPVPVACYESTDAFWEKLDTKTLRHKAILIKGSRKYRLEKLVNRLQAKQRITTLEIDLKHLEKNLKFFQSKLQPKVKTMVMVKAFAYGSGSFEIAHFFQNQRSVDYLVVAYSDEGVLLREKGITIPIMVLSPSASSYETMIQHNIEPEIYSLLELKGFLRAAKSMRHFFDVYPIHLKLNTGMNRLGFEQEELEKALELIKTSPYVLVSTVFTHLSATDGSEHDDFTHTQVKRFNALNELVVKRLGYQPDRHVLNSNGVLRFPEYHFEIVRLGIGLYGFSEDAQNRFLAALGSLKSYIIQIRKVPAGESVGYSRKGTADHPRRIATVALGYADGLDRRLGNGNWSIRWQGVDCPTVGNICMDMTMIDVTDTQAREGDEVIVMEGKEDIVRMADLLETIPYEILTSIPERVRRVYLQE